MKALTLYEPFARLVGVGVKSVETRSWGTSYRGPLAIHAAKKWDDEVCADIERVRADLKKCWALCGLGLRDDQKAMLYDLPWRDGLGCVLAVVNMVDCRPMVEAPDRVEELFGSFGPGRWGWVFRGVEPLPSPIPCRGNRMLWELPADVEERVTENLLDRRKEKS